MGHRRTGQKKKSGKYPYSINLSVSEADYERLCREADEINIPLATYCRKLLEAGSYTFQLRQPKEMEVLEEICANVTGIHEEDMEILRQVRFSGQFTEAMGQIFSKRTASLDRLVRKLEE